ncbi:hypothetical protein HZI30_05425 [Serratia fonticola]|uniref:hypothetical protein n=1 Tax=Serratia fonticola TaxID=47917 RepID=UPI0015C5DEC5|nr:hypothetical protein [Serratia fonticola]NXZ86376.1 hypothetical protein [Serratia fonticola]
MTTVTTEAIAGVADLKAGYTLGHADVAILKAISAELLSVRKAQSVPAGKFVLEPSEQRYHHIKHGEYQHTEPKFSLVKLYTAPPAPAVTGKTRLSPRMYADCVNMLQEIAIAFHSTGQLRARLNSVLGQYVEPDHPHTRDAMLQPVSEPYKLPDVAPTDEQLMAFAERHRLKLDKAWLLQIWEDAISLAAAPTPTKAESES